ncbi:MAG: ABC transporter permease [Gemmatimonadota bacterium]
MSGDTARRLIRALSAFVPSHRRSEWLEEWLAELAVLERLSAAERRSAGLPGLAGFALGALPHALWTQREGWTMDSVRMDLRYALRGLRRNPLFAIAAAVTLALGVAANASIFALINGLLLRPPADVSNPERLVQIARSYETDPRWDNFSWPALKLIESEADAFESVAGVQDAAFVIGEGADVEQVHGQYVTGSYFPLLGLTPAAGRLLYPSDDLEPGAHAVVVLGHSLWIRRFGGDPSVIGRSIRLGSQPFEVVGVAPAGFQGVRALGGQPALWVPTMQSPPVAGRLPFDEWGWSSYDVIGRLREGVTFAAARASMDVVSTRLREASATNRDMVVLLEPGVGLDPSERAEATRISLILFLIVGVVLLIACSNVASLFLARTSGRRGELGVRQALGAGRLRVARHLVTESVLLGLASSVVALPIVLSSGRFLPALFPYSFSASLAPDASVFAVLLGLGVAAGILFGVLPAWMSTRGDLAGTLREGAPTAGRRRQRARDGLVVAQLGLSLGLVAAAGLLGRSILNARSADPGFRPDGLTTAVLYLDPTGRYDSEGGRALFGRISDAVAALPGVQAVTLANQMPIAGGHSRATVRPLDRDDVDYEAENIIVGKGYFETLGIPIHRGRALRGPGEEPEPVVVINEALAELFWPGQDPIGQYLAGEPSARVVGVAADVQMRSLRAPARPAVYHPLDARYSSLMVLHVRAQPGRTVSAPDLRTVIGMVDPGLPVPSVVDLRSAVASSLQETRTIGLLIAVFAGLALVLAAVGLYGLIAFTASQRVREMGIRMALGAERGTLVWLILLRGLTVTGLGLGAGLLIAAALGSALRSLLFGVRASDPAVLGAAVLALVVTALLAAWIPARRASRLDAVRALTRP